MTLRPLPLFLALGLIGCGPVDISDGNDCDPCGDDDGTEPDDDDGTEPDDDDGTEPDDDEPAPQADLRVTITTPGGVQYGSMLCHVEFLDDTDGDGSFSDEYWGWEYSWVENWVTSTTLEANPGSIDGVRLNCTLCPDELTLDEEPYSPEAEAMGCTWLAVNGSGSTNGNVATWYFGETFGSSLVSVAGGTSVLVDLR